MIGVDTTRVWFDPVVLLPTVLRRPLVVDRQSVEWLRLRLAVGDGHAPYIDPAQVADDVWITLYGRAGVGA